MLCGTTSSLTRVHPKSTPPEFAPRTHQNSPQKDQTPEFAPEQPEFAPEPPELAMRSLNCPEDHQNSCQNHWVVLLHWGISQCPLKNSVHPPKTHPGASRIPFHLSSLHSSLCHVSPETPGGPPTFMNSLGPFQKLTAPSHFVEMGPPYF